eukprot:CAMPEP_0202964156 /NCGR_PEP_ID=MMETSP1396-20130829/8227_1 /ASSEMBLY_ACC=CAM_ASM_000872 /TAXON_ID= /ORGANISM="Pseudokeronopsis sp., Strain Brazil" /LENGTH=82 /DNA_ID=CAMNT_0049686031 /DNA_START=1958 /DNA_END=2206 /DNA_ORIENTATION=-
MYHENGVMAFTKDKKQEKQGVFDREGKEMFKAGPHLCAYLNGMGGIARVTDANYEATFNKEGDKIWEKQKDSVVWFGDKGRI